MFIRLQMCDDEISIVQFDVRILNTFVFSAKTPISSCMVKYFNFWTFVVIIIRNFAKKFDENCSGVREILINLYWPIKLQNDSNCVNALKNYNTNLKSISSVMLRTREEEDHNLLRIEKFLVIFFPDCRLLSLLPAWVRGHLCFLLGSSCSVPAHPSSWRLCEMRWCWF